MTGSILGNRVVRKEDPKFLTVGGTYLADLQEPRLEGAVYATYARSAMAHARITSIDTSAAEGNAGRRRRAHRARSRARIGAVTVQPGRPSAAAGHGDGPLRRRAPRRRPERDTRDRGRRRRADRRRLRPAPRDPRARGGARGRRHLSRRRREPRLRHGHAGHARRHRRQLLRRLRGGGEGPDRQPARGSLPPRGPQRGSGLGGRQARPVAVHPARPRGPRHRVGRQRAGEGRRPHHRPRRGRRLRRQDRRLSRGAAPRPPVQGGRAARAVARDPLREHARPRPRPGPAAGLRHRRHPGRPGAGLSPGGPVRTAAPSPRSAPFWPRS